MRTDICEPYDEAACAQFKRILHELGAVVIDEGGVDVFLTRYRIGNDTLNVFRPEELVRRIVDKMTCVA